jgi:hypothetical protein
MSPSFAELAKSRHNRAYFKDAPFHFGVNQLDLLWPEMLSALTAEFGANSAVERHVSIVLNSAAYKLRLLKGMAEMAEDRMRWMDAEVRVQMNQPGILNLDDLPDDMKAKIAEFLKDDGS